VRHEGLKKDPENLEKWCKSTQLPEILSL